MVRPPQALPAPSTDRGRVLGVRGVQQPEHARDVFVECVVHPVRTGDGDAESRERSAEHVLHAAACPTGRDREEARLWRPSGKFARVTTRSQRSRSARSRCPRQHPRRPDARRTSRVSPSAARTRAASSSGRSASATGQRSSGRHRRCPSATSRAHRAVHRRSPRHPASPCPRAVPRRRWPARTCSFQPPWPSPPAAENAT